MNISLPVHQRERLADIGIKTERAVWKTAQNLLNQLIRTTDDATLAQMVKEYDEYHKSEL